MRKSCAACCGSLRMRGRSARSSWSKSRPAGDSRAGATCNLFSIASRRRSHPAIRGPSWKHSPSLRISSLSPAAISKRFAASPCRRTSSRRSKTGNGSRSSVIARHRDARPSTRRRRPFSTISASLRSRSCLRWPISIHPTSWRCLMPPPRPPRRQAHSRARSSGPTPQPSLALQRIAESLPLPKHKRSTDEVFNEPQRLHKVLASCGFGSRRAMEEMILAGRITVNRMPAEVGQKVGPGDEVRINGDIVKVRFAEPRARVLMYHKPAGELVTRDDPEGRPTVFEKLPSIGNGRWINIGRLDYNTEGLLLFTNSGELANRLMHPRYEVEREYAVRIMGRMTEEQANALTAGVTLDDGPARCEKVADGGGDEDGSNHWYHVVLKEGRNREVRRLFEALGLMVSRLIRTRYGVLAMPTSLKRGNLQELEAADVNALVASAGLNAAASGGAPKGDRRDPRAGGQHARKGFFLMIRRPP